MAFRAPLLGYNTNVRHKGKLYHIQTEDSGIDHPHVITHLFADGGRIVASKKTSYAERVGSDGLPDQVKKLMQGQHKAMFISLRDGIYDEDASDDVPEPTTDPRLRKPPAADLRGGPDDPDALAASIKLDGASVGELPVAAAPAAQLLPPTPAEQLDEIEEIELQPDPDEPQPVSERAPLYQSALAPVRLEASPLPTLASIHPRAEGPRAATSGDDGLAGGSVANSGGAPRSLFGGDLLSDKSLDEVILNYLAANEKDG